MVIDASQIHYSIEKALYWATHGRIGHCWLDIPLDVQGVLIGLRMRSRSSRQQLWAW